MVVLLRAMLPPLIWFACFSLLYGLATVTCGRGLLAGNAQYFSIALAAAAIAGLAVAAMLRIEQRPFLTMVARSLSGLASLAVVWLIAPLLVLERCEAAPIGSLKSNFIPVAQKLTPKTEVMLTCPGSCLALSGGTASAFRRSAGNTGRRSGRHG